MMMDLESEARTTPPQGRNRRRSESGAASSDSPTKKVVQILTRKVERTVGEIIVVVAVLAFIGYSGLAQLDQLRENDVNRALAETDRVAYDTRLAAYNVELRAYDTAIAANALCLDSVARSDNNRDQWTQLAVIVEALDNGSGRAATLADQIREGPLLASQPRSITDCPIVPPVPVPPTREDA